MLADRTLLVATLATTACAGFTTGWAARDRRGDPAHRPTDAQQVYASQLDALRAKGYDEQEMRDALRIHQQYLDTYQEWWNRFLEQHDRNLTKIDRLFEDELQQLDVRFRERAAAAPQPR
jgi:hypothetical protein